MSLKRFINLMLRKERNFRAEAIRDKVNNKIIDTVWTPDTQKWETAIGYDGNWIIVEMYPNAEEAHKGHEKWCQEVRKNPNQKFKNCISVEDWIFGNY